MLDFVRIKSRMDKKAITIYPDFKVLRRSKDLMTRGHSFYAVWDETENRWSTNETTVAVLVDEELEKKAAEYPDDSEIKVAYLSNFSSKKWTEWQQYVKSLPSNYHALDNKLIFSNQKARKEDYSSKSLDYPLEEGDISAYDELIGTLYDEEERRKIEWAIGSIVAGESREIQKFVVLYGSAGTGKSTIINIIQMLFDGYCATFSAKAIGSKNNAFALSAFATNPLVAVEHDADLSRIEDNTKLNSLISHEVMTINEKYKAPYSAKFNTFLFIGTNKPVRITEAKSGLIRRLIDVHPSGRLIERNRYELLRKKVKFELGGIAKHCLDVYKSMGRGYYDTYKPVEMIGATNDFYNFVEDSYEIFAENNYTTLSSAWRLYDEYCKDARVPYPFSKRAFKNELKNYFEEFKERYCAAGNKSYSNYYSGFLKEKFIESTFGQERKSAEADDGSQTNKPEQPLPSWLELKQQKSLFDDLFRDCRAQYGVDKDGELVPRYKWDNVKKTLADINTSKLHYVMTQDLDEHYIAVDFDLKGDDGKKSLERNLAAASAWPPTYVETSKSGAGLHLIYYYDGDPSMLSYLYSDDIEIKKATGGSSLRRKLTVCNDHEISHISSGLPLKGEKMVDFKGFNDEKALRNMIRKNLSKQIVQSTHQSISLIYSDLESCYNSGMHYDVSDLRNAVLTFATGSTNHADECVRIVSRMKFKSEEATPALAEAMDEVEKVDDSPIVFFDVEVFPNLFVLCWKRPGDTSVVSMINPEPTEIEELFRYKLVGFNNRRYDNHILYARAMGYTNPQLYKLSQKIITEGAGFLGEAYGLSYLDLYDMSSKKQSLKKFEIELGIHHQELGLPWDQPVPEKYWEKVAEYCCNDVLATEAVFNDRQADFVAREILADVSGLSVNDTTNSHTTKIIFGNDRSPQKSFNYRNLGKKITGGFTYEEAKALIADNNRKRKNGEDISLEYSLDRKPYFPGYEFEWVKKGAVSIPKSTYRGEEVGEGGYVYAEPGMYTNVALLDISSMHPSTIVAEQLFGEKYTSRFKELLDARLAIKHGEFGKAKDMLGGSLAKYLTDESSADMLSKALKIAINSVYGLTSAKFSNPFRDVRNVDNIVAKRGALFMVDLKHAVQERGYTVAHIKTDSIKIPNATPEIIQFVTDFGKLYGYNFEHEATYDRMCLVNNAVYICKFSDAEETFKQYGYYPTKQKKKSGKWEATGTQFAVPYVFKTLFSHENIEFDDLCETKSVTGTSAIYIDDQLSADELERIGFEDISEVERFGPVLATINGDHHPRFIGRVGRFCPMKPGYGGGALYRVKDGKVYNVTGTKGYSWLESEVVKTLGKEEGIDRQYYTDLVDAAISSISEYGDFEWFVSDEPCTNAEAELFSDLPF